MKRRNLRLALMMMNPDHPSAAQAGEMIGAIRRIKG